MPHSPHKTRRRRVQDVHGVSSPLTSMMDNAHPLHPQILPASPSRTIPRRRRIHPMLFGESVDTVVVRVQAAGAK
jgi:hypothetical protein